MIKTFLLYNVYLCLYFRAGTALTFITNELLWEQTSDPNTGIMSQLSQSLDSVDTFRYTAIKVSMPPDYNTEFDFLRLYIVKKLMYAMMKLLKE